MIAEMIRNRGGADSCLRESAIPKELPVAPKREYTPARQRSAIRGAERCWQGLRLPPPVHDESHYRLWQRRFYPSMFFSEKKFPGEIRLHATITPYTPDGQFSGRLAVVKLEVLLLGGSSILRMDRRR